ncbi:MAG: hypothetical protein GPOALKHO_000552 [Sodalis sp.]|nr:MAG: hypothetical protein GPOALKHO_000552 [Sodalis sp.]
MFQERQSSIYAEDSGYQKIVNVTLVIMMIMWALMISGEIIPHSGYC